MVKRSLASIYKSYEDGHTIAKCEEYSLWTIPSVMPLGMSDSNNKNGNVPVQHDYQSVGAMLTNYLASTLAGLLFPINQSFFKLSPAEDFAKQNKAVLDRAGDQINTKLAQLETAASKRIFVDASYASINQALKNLVITGNTLIHRKPDKLVVYSLHKYVTKRDNEGNLYETILRENWSYGTLPQDLANVINVKNKQPEDECTVYTSIKREIRKDVLGWVVTQQLDDQDIGTPSWYPDKLCPYIAVTWNLIAGDDYGRGIIEDYAGDFAKLSAVSEALATYELDACKIVNVVRAGATVDLESMNKAQRGEWVQADPAAIAAHEGGEAAKIQSLAADLQNIFQRLAPSFMYTANVREGERVTAYELQQLAITAEKALGGVYSQLSAGLHVPLAYLLCQEVDPKFILGVISKELQITVLTGVAALGRSTETQQLVAAIQELAAIIPVMKQLSARFDTEKVIDNVLLSHGLNLDDLMLSDEALKQQMEAQANVQPQPTVDPTQGVEAVSQII
jgi:hypothetical protein